MSCWEGSLAFGLVNWLNCVHWFIYFWLPAWNCTHSCIGLNQSLIFKKSWDRILWCTLYNRKRSEFPFIWKWWELVWHHKSNRWYLFAVSSFVSFKSTLTRKLQREEEKKVYIISSDDLQFFFHLWRIWCIPPTEFSLKMYMMKEIYFPARCPTRFDSSRKSSEDSVDCKISLWKITVWSPPLLFIVIQKSTHPKGLSPISFPALSFQKYDHEVTKIMMKPFTYRNSL